ncbi:hypothetical protein A9Q84_15635 [Halobacteriovorax marinus]|uniref:Response regulatory domain-containing protein n=1 Tax=Halobacteriovorax marinus TaxID=97084 RepID=A0A1Y5FAC8_9BACT|nr:hypothetical protein A9Q84_15635 [Halobacteriovorax marinus]
MRKKKILLIEDSSDYSSLLNISLKREGCVTKIARDGQEALALIEDGKYKPDLLLLDLMMPKMNGIEFLENLDKDNLAKNSKICVLTAKHDMKDIEKAFDLGAHEYFLKSDNLVVLLEKLYELMEIEKRPIPENSNEFISVLEVTNVIHDFNIIDFNENTVKLYSSEELPLKSRIQIKSDKLKKFKKSKNIINCIVEGCELVDDQVLITCNFLDKVS